MMLNVDGERMLVKILILPANAATSANGAIAANAALPPNAAIAS